MSRELCNTLTIAVSRTIPAPHFRSAINLRPRPNGSVMITCAGRRFEVTTLAVLTAHEAVAHVEYTDAERYQCEVVSIGPLLDGTTHYVVEIGVFDTQAERRRNAAVRSPIIDDLCEYLRTDPVVCAYVLDRERTELINNLGAMRYGTSELPTRDALLLRVQAPVDGTLLATYLNIKLQRDYGMTSGESLAHAAHLAQNRERRFNALDNSRYTHESRDRMLVEVVQATEEWAIQNRARRQQEAEQRRLLNEERERARQAEQALILNQVQVWARNDLGSMLMRDFSGETEGDIYRAGISRRETQPEPPAPKKVDVTPGRRRILL